MKKTDFERVLSEDHVLIYRNTGDSMMPLVKEGRDLVVIEDVNGRKLHKYEVPLYKRGEKYILHRILKVEKDGYVCCGDNRWGKERGVRDEQIIGVMTSVIRKGKEMTVSSKKYLLYVHLWCDLYIIRAGILMIGALLNKLCRSIRKRRF